MSHKTFVKIAAVMIVVFTLVVVVYPLLFGSNRSAVSEPTAVPLVNDLKDLKK